MGNNAIRGLNSFSIIFILLLLYVFININKDFKNHNFKLFDIKYDLILSDIAPNSTGHALTDHLRIINIIEDIIFLLEQIALKKSSFIFKIFKGSQEKNLIKIIKKFYGKVSYFKPNSSRKNSSEIYIIAQNFLGIGKS